MTFSELKTAIKDYCNLTSTEADTRIGKSVNRHYRRITSTLGLDTVRFVTRSQATSAGVATVTFTEIEKIDRIIDVTDSTAIRLLDETSIHELRATQPGTGQPTLWATQNTDADSVTVRLDVQPAATYTLQADGITTLSDLTSSDEPVFPESFHDILVWEVIAEELLKKEKDKLAQTYKKKADELLAELRFHLADSPTRTTRQGGGSVSAASGSGGGSSNVGASIYTQTGLITFDRDTDAPFAVTDTSAYVPNLYAEGVGNVTTDRIIGRDTTGTGESEQLTVGGGLEFTGSGGIQRSALTGDVTASAGSGATTIANDAVTTAKILADNVTFAKMQNIATDSLMGRDAASTGDPENILLNATLEMDGSGNLRRAALTGDVTASAGSNATTIANDAVTYAKMQNVSAASRLLGRGSAAGSGDVEEITIGSGLSLSGTALSATASSAWALLRANSGTTTNAAAETVDSIAISGLTALDTLIVYTDVESVTQQTAGFVLTNTTDTLDLTGTRTFAAGAGALLEWRLRQSQAGATAVDAQHLGSLLTGSLASDGGRKTFTTNWTGSWTLGLTHDGVTAGGTFRWSWAVYKVVGQ